MLPGQQDIQSTGRITQQVFHTEADEVLVAKP